MEVYRNRMRRPDDQPLYSWKAAQGLPLRGWSVDSGSCSKDALYCATGRV